MPNKRLEFVTAIMVAFEEGDKGPLTAMIASGHPTNDEDRALLVTYIMGGFKKIRGRKTPSSIVHAARLVKLVKSELRRRRQSGELRIFRGRIHDAAIEHAFDILRSENLPVPDRDVLENYLRRPKSSSTKRLEKILGRSRH